MKVLSVLKCFKRKNSVIPIQDNSVVDVLSNNWTDSNELENNKNECIICLENDNELDLTLPCMHRFHKKCVINWYKQSNNLWCPICKTNFKRSILNTNDGIARNIRYNNNVELNEPRSFHLNLSNQVIHVPIAPANTPPRIARFRTFRSRLNRINVEG